MGDFGAGAPLDVCPGAYQAQNCTSGNRSDTTDSTLAWVNTSSSLASITGSILMLTWYLCDPNIRTGFRKISTWLAAYNLLLAAGSLLGSLNFLVYRYQPPNATVNGSIACEAYIVVCYVQGFVTLSSSLSTFVWNACLGVYLYLRFKKGVTFATRWSMWLVYHTVPALIPLLIAIPLAATGYLGYSPYSSGSGCVIAAASSNNNTSIVDHFTSMYVGIVSSVKGFELVTYVLMVLFFCITLKHIGASKLDETISRTWKMLTVPFTFVFLRMWGTITFFLTILLYYSGHIEDSTGCVAKPLHGLMYSLRILQAIGDPGQGWANALLFLFISSNIRSRLLQRWKHKKLPYQKPSFDEGDKERVSTRLESSHRYPSCHSSTGTSDGYADVDPFASYTTNSYYTGVSDHC